MVLAGSVDIPLDAVRAQIASAINIVLHQSRMPDGSRKIIQIAELKGYDPSGRPVLEDIYRFRRGTDGVGMFEASGVRPKSLDKMSFYEVSVPDELFDPSATLVIAREGPLRESLGELQVGEEEGEAAEASEADLMRELTEEPAEDGALEAEGAADGEAKVLQKRRGERRKVQMPITVERRRAPERRETTPIWDPYKMVKIEEPGEQEPARVDLAGAGPARSALHRRAQERGRKG